MGIFATEQLGTTLYYKSGHPKYKGDVKVSDGESPQEVAFGEGHQKRHFCYVSYDLYSYNIGGAKKVNKAYGSYRSKLDLEKVIKEIPSSEACFYELLHTFKTEDYSPEDNALAEPQSFSTSSVEYYDLDADENKANIGDWLGPDGAQKAYETFIHYRERFNNHVRSKLLHSLPFSADSLRVLNSSRPGEKLSLHIIHRSIYFTKCTTQRSWVKELFKPWLHSLNEPLASRLASVIDESVYTKNRAFRLEGCTKYGQDRPLQRLDPTEHPSIEYMVTQPYNDLVHTKVSEQDIQSYLKPLPSYGDVDSDDEDTVVATNAPGIVWEESASDRSKVETLEELYQLIGEVASEHKLSLQKEDGDLHYCVLRDIWMMATASYVKDEPELHPEVVDLLEKYLPDLYYQGHIPGRVDVKKMFKGALDVLSKGSLPQGKKPISVGSLHRYAKENPRYQEVFPPEAPKKINYGATLLQLVKGAVPQLKIKGSNIEYYNKGEDILSLNSTDKCQVVVADMGYGKTEALVKYLDSIENESIISITPLITISNDQKARFPLFQHYLSLNGPLKADRLICEFESLWRVENAKSYDIVVLDEFSSILSKINSPTARGNFQVLFNTMKRLVRNARQILVLDADFDQSSYDHLSSLLGEDPQVSIYTKPRSNMSARLTDDMNDWLQHLFDALGNNQKVSIALTSPSKLESLTKLISSTYPHLRIKGVSGETPSEEKEELIQNFEETLLSLDVFLYTPALSHGVSFTKKHFDRAFAYLTPHARVPVETVLQMLRRIRCNRLSQVDIFAPARTGNLPSTREEVEKALQEKLNHPRLLPTGLIYEHTNTGGYTFPFKNDIYRLFISSQVKNNLSNNNFLPRLVSLMRMRGYKVSYLPPPQEYVDHIPALKECAGEVKEDNLQLLESAPQIEEEEYLALVEKRQVLSKVEQCSVEKYDLTQLYMVPYKTLTRAFLKKYTPAPTKKRFRNLRTLRFSANDKGSVELAVIGLYEDDKHKIEHAKGESILLDLNFSGKKNFYAHMMVRALGFESVLDETTTLEEKDMLKSWSIFWSEISEETAKTYISDICHCFEKRSIPFTHPNDKWWTVVTILKFVNGLLTSMYGSSIKTSKKGGKGARTGYQIKLSALFDGPGLPSTIPKKNVRLMKPKNDSEKLFRALGYIE